MIASVGWSQGAYGKLASALGPALASWHSESSTRTAQSLYERLKEAASNLRLHEIDQQNGIIDDLWMQRVKVCVSIEEEQRLQIKLDGRIEELASGGFPLGIMPGAEFEVGEAHLNPGETLVIYSDGVSEANNIREEEFGMERLIAVVRNNLQASAAGMRDKVESALSSFTQTAPANDDITLVIVKRV